MVAASCGCKILHTKRMIADTMRTANDTREVSVHAAYKIEDYWAEVFLHSLSSTSSKVKIIRINILFLI